MSSGGSVDLSTSTLSFMGESFVQTTPKATTLEERHNIYCYVKGAFGVACAINITLLVIGILGYHKCLPPGSCFANVCIGLTIAALVVNNSVRKLSREALAAPPPPDL